MKIDETNPTAPAYELKDELARLCLPSANRDANLKLAWVNSVCILFLLIGLVGARRGVIAIKPAPPIEEMVPVILAPVTLPPQETEQNKSADEDKNDAPRSLSSSRMRPTSVSACQRLAHWWCRPVSPPHRRWNRCGQRANQCRQQHRRWRRTAATAVSQTRAGRRRAGHGPPRAGRRRGGQCGFRGREGIVRLSIAGPRDGGIYQTPLAAADRQRAASFSKPASPTNCN